MYFIRQNLVVLILLSTARNFPVLESSQIVEVVEKLGTRSALPCTLHTAGQVLETPRATHTVGLSGIQQGEGATSGTPTPIPAPNGSRGRNSCRQQQALPACPPL